MIEKPDTSKILGAALAAQLERLERGETIEQIATDYATWKETSGV